MEPYHSDEEKPKPKEKHKVPGIQVITQDPFGRDQPKSILKKPTTFVQQTTNEKPVAAVVVEKVKPIPQHM